MRQRSSWFIGVAFFVASGCGYVYAQKTPSDVAALEKAEEIDVGSFCLSNIAPGSRVVKVGQSHVESDGSLWWDVHIKVDTSDQRKPTAYFYSKLRQPSTGGGITECKDTANLAFLKGKLNAANIHAYYRPGTHVPPPQQSESSRWQIKPGNLDVEFGAAEAQIGPLYGASVTAHDAKPNATTLTNRVLDVKNPSSELFFDLTNNKQTGILQISTTDVVLSKTKLVIGAKAMSVDLTCRYLSGPNQGKVTFSRNVSTGEAGFVSGECSKSEVDLPADDWTEADLTATVTSANAKKVSLTGDPDHPELRLSTLTIATPRSEVWNGDSHNHSLFTP
jgi:hypothetical protein